MYKLLIVDDENIVVEDIRQSVHWQDLHVTTVLTASNIGMAKEIIENNDIDIMLCDIEMPQGSGLELLSWVKVEHPMIQTIFLSCHADFYYAKEAIRLGSLDYLLKPVLFEELEKSIARAIDKIRSDSKLQEFSRYGRFWFKNQPVIIERFWLDIIQQKIPSTRTEIKKAADYRNIPFTEQIQILPVLVRVQKWHEKMNLQDEKIMEFALKNIAEEIFAGGGRSIQCLELQRGMLLCILSPGMSEDSLEDGLIDRSNDYISKCNHFLKCDLSCYLGESAYANQLADLVERLLMLEKNNVAHINRVLSLNGASTITGEFDIKDMSLWSLLVMDGAREKLLNEVMNYLTDLSQSSGLNANTLYQFQQYFTQMLYKALDQKGIQIKELLNDNEFIQLQIKAPNSVTDMIEWIQYIVNKSLIYANEVEKSESVINSVKKFIQLNLDKELSREDVARHVYLNPDYLDRIYKKKTGVSVSKYMLQERLKIAQELLSKTDLPISTIAAKVGYCNHSNFSCVFKKMHGMNPAEYRKAVAN